MLCYPAWNCVNHDAFRPMPKQPAVSFASRAIDIKNPMLMAEVVDRVLRKRSEVRFSILGGGPRMAPLQRRLSALGWDRQVSSGYVEDPSPIVNRSLVHVALERFDNFTNQSMLEGMAAGCATVASDVGETRRVVTDDLGILVPLDPAAIADAILQLLDHPERAQAMGRKARERVMQNHHVDRYIDYLRQVEDLSRPGPIVDGVRDELAEAV
jgi:glycosyltransferase involved in cell wall biosynthesis